MNNENNDHPKVILGIDPGTLVTGYGIISARHNVLEALDFGCIRPPKDFKLSDRYLIIHDSVEQLIDRYKPQAVVVETQYVHKNVQSAIKLGMARGVVMIAAKRKGIPVFEYSPTKAKAAVTGAGSANKFQVQGMVQKLLSLKHLPEPADAADALALAICHANNQLFTLKTAEI